MDITPVLSKTRQLIQGYGGGSFTIANQSYEGSVMVFADRTVPFAAATFEDIYEAGLAPIFSSEEKIEVLLIGSGPRQRFIPQELREALRQRGIVP